jgi:hypothetical protein
MPQSHAGAQRDKNPGRFFFLPTTVSVVPLSASNPGIVDDTAGPRLACSRAERRAVTLGAQSLEIVITSLFSVQHPRAIRMDNRRDLPPGHCYRKQSPWRFAQLCPGSQAYYIS